MSETQIKYWLRRFKNRRNLGESYPPTVKTAKNME